MIPTIDGEMLRFTNAGLYDGLFVMQDTKTLTLWNHVNGEAMYGELLGQSLEVSGVLLQTTVELALAMDPDMLVAISPRPFGGSGPGFTATSFGRGGLGEPPPAGPGRGPGRGSAPPPSGPDPEARMMEMFEVTLGEEDTRFERMAMGLGVWSDSGDLRRFYPFDLIREQGALIDEVGGRNLLVYYDAPAAAPAAMFVNADSATVEDRETIRLNNGQAVVGPQLLDVGGEVLATERPNQVFTRWYGFSLTFPGPEIYGE